MRLQASVSGAGEQLYTTGAGWGTSIDALCAEGERWQGNGFGYTSQTWPQSPPSCSHLVVVRMRVQRVRHSKGCPHVRKATHESIEMVAEQNEYFGRFDSASCGTPWLLVEKRHLSEYGAARTRGALPDFDKLHLYHRCGGGTNKRRRRTHSAALWRLYHVLHFSKLVFALFLNVGGERQGSG